MRNPQFHAYGNSPIKQSTLTYSQLYTQEEHFSEILSPPKGRPFCLGINVLSDSDYGKTDAGMQAC